MLSLLDDPRNSFSAMVWANDEWEVFDRNRDILTKIWGCFSIEDKVHMKSERCMVTPKLSLSVTDLKASAMVKSRVNNAFLKMMNQSKPSTIPNRSL